jgi:hypothetical protein
MVVDLLEMVHHLHRVLVVQQDKHGLDSVHVRLVLEPIFPVVKCPADDHLEIVQLHHQLEELPSMEVLFRELLLSKQVQLAPVGSSAG